MTPKKKPAAATASVSFAQDILPLFRQVDIQHLGGMGVELDSDGYMSVPANAHSVYSMVSSTEPLGLPAGH